MSYNEIVIARLRSFPRLFWILLIPLVVSSCTSSQAESILLASFTENDVNVSILLAEDDSGIYILSATFTPPKGYHLYSKDIPANGINGLGRPTLLALTSSSRMKTSGPLSESAQPQTPDFEPKELLVYPQGSVTLRQPIQPPAGDPWESDEISVTYMACSASQCKPPVVGKVVSLQIPDMKDIKIK